MVRATCHHCSQQMPHGHFRVVRHVKKSPRWMLSLQWRHKGRDCVSNHQPHHCLFNRLFRRRSKKTSKLRVADPLCREFSGDRPVTRKMFPFDDVIMYESLSAFCQSNVAAVFMCYNWLIILIVTTSSSTKKHPHISWKYSRCKMVPFDEKILELHSLLLA